MTGGPPVSDKPPPLEPLSRLRVKLTIWYVATLTLIVGCLGLGLFLAIRAQYARETRRSLRLSTGEVIRLAQARGWRPDRDSAPAVPFDQDARRRERATFLLAVDGRPISPARADEWIRQAAIRAADSGAANAESDGPHDTILRLHAERFTLSDGTPLIAAVVDRSMELEDRYAELIASFGAAAGAALILVGFGSWVLLRQVTIPIERTFDHMRRFMADAAHELRTPVTVVRTRAEVSLQQPRGPTEYVATLRGIESEARHLGAVVDSLLVLARAEAGERPKDMVRVYLDDIVLEAAQSVMVIAQAKGVALSVDDYEESVVSGDALLLRQLVLNILDNAIKFTPSGGSVAVRVNTEGGRPTLSVEDSGIGIAAGDIAHIFERFYRADSARPRGEETERDRGGAGLGLAIVRWIADVHDAEISVLSSPGKGTRVVVRFPVCVVTE